MATKKACADVCTVDADVVRHSSICTTNLLFTVVELTVSFPGRKVGEASETSVAVDVDIVQPDPVCLDAFTSWIAGLAIRARQHLGLIHILKGVEMVDESLVPSFIVEWVLQLAVDGQHS